MSIEDEAARLLARLRRAGDRGVPEGDLVEGSGSETAAALGSLRSEGSAILWARRWHVVDGVRWWPGTFTRRGRAGGVVRRAEPVAPRRGRRQVADELFVAEKDRGGARQGDFVLVRPVRSPASRRPRPGELPLGVVVAVLRRARRRLVGEVVRSGRGAAAPVEVRSWDSEQALDARDVRVEGARQLASGTWVVLELGETRRDGTIPARVEEVLGTLEEPGTDLAVVLRHFDIVEPFPPEVLAEAGRLPSAPAEADSKGRRDHRRDLAVTIDGEHARDFDDAIDVTRTREGFLARVHIADVAHYVRPGSAIDREASRRGTSVYFPERAVHMLPGALSEELCSLKPGVDRLAMTVEMRFDAHGSRTGASFRRSVIRSAARLTYRQVEDHFRSTARAGGTEVAPDVATLLDSARRLAAVLLERRQDRGAIDFLLPEVELRIDEMGAIVHVEQAERLESQRVIEELMIAANEAVAEELDRRLHADGPAALYRVHAPPSSADLEPLARLATTFGIDAPRVGADGGLDSGELARMLRQARERGGAGVLEQLTLRAMSRAQYAPTCDGHFALAAPFYCHFTSPIRRYPDLVDHRRLAELLGAATPNREGESETPEALARRLSERERVAEAAERALRRWKKLRYLEERVGSEWRGTITGVEEFGVFVMLDDLAVDGLVSVERLDDDFYEHDPQDLALVGRRTGRRWRLGDAVKARIEAVDPVRRRVDLALVPGAPTERRSAPREESRPSRPARGRSRREPRTARRGR